MRRYIFKIIQNYNEMSVVAKKKIKKIKNQSDAKRFDYLGQY